MSKEYKYYSILRPISLGAHPDKNVLRIRNFDDRTFCEEIEREAWGYVVYSEPLTGKEAKSYDLWRAPQ